MQELIGAAPARRNFRVGWQTVYPAVAGIGVVPPTGWEDGAC
jgi:hypothetical protein